MKNILIPTTFQDDTVFAVETALSHAGGTICNIVLMMPLPMPDAFSSGEFLRQSRHTMLPYQANVIDKCRIIVSSFSHCNLEIRTQLGVSGPLVRNLMDYLSVSLIIIPASYKGENAKTHSRFLEILSKQKCPILQLGNEAETPEFSNALYLDYNKNELNIQQLQQCVNNQFSFKIVSHAEVADMKSSDELTLLNEAIEKNNIDLLIETRRAKPYSGKNKNDANKLLGLPVLSLNEEAVRA